VPTCHVATFGCRVNQADSEGIAEALGAREFARSPSHADADLVVINSCTVTHRSDADIRKLVNRVQRENPDAKVVVTGCYAQRDPDALVQLAGTSAVVGHSDAHRLGEVIDKLMAGDGGDAPIVLVNPIEDAEFPPIDPVAVVHERTRPFIKIQDGCDAACTYCVIPSVRGGARSAAPNKVVRSVQKLVADGYYEVVLTGVHLGTYVSDPTGPIRSDRPPASNGHAALRILNGRADLHVDGGAGLQAPDHRADLRAPVVSDGHASANGDDADAPANAGAGRASRASRSDGAALLALVARVLEEVPELGRLRLSCIEPMAFPTGLAALAASDPRLAPHFHLPLQSGSDRILRRMGRPYRAAELQAVLDQLRAAVPRACLGTDVIVGFPGETEADFEATCEFVRQSGLQYVHVFSYSDREGVPSTRLSDKVDPRIVKQRSQHLNAIGKTLWRAFLDGQVGTTLDAITLGPSKQAFDNLEALSDNFCRVLLPSEGVESNRNYRVRITDRQGDVLRGELADTAS